VGCLERKCVKKERREDMENEPKVPNGVSYATREEVKEGILELFSEQDEFKTQKEIVNALLKKGIFTKQVMVSRVLEGLELERNENGFWAWSEKGEYRQRLKALGELFEKIDGSPRLYSRVETVILRTEPNYNVLLAKQIADTFEDEVLSTFCPNETDIVIYYQRRKKTRGGVQETSQWDVESEEGVQETSPVNIKSEEQADAESEEAEISIQPVTEDPYKKSRMRIEIVKLCKKIRKKNQ
jgi:arginine repressor